MLEVIPLEAVRSSAEQDLAAASVDSTVDAALAAAYLLRWKNAQYLTQLRQQSVNTPELKTKATTVYEQVQEAERLLVAPHHLAADYELGTARYENELVGVGDSTWLLTEAQHGTSIVRKNREKGATVSSPDYGTAGLAYVLAQQGIGRSIIPLGRQTSGANGNPEHPIQKEIVAQFAHTPYTDFVSVHGMYPGKVTHLRDTTEVHAVLGLGLNPRQASVELAKKVQSEAKDRYDLRVLLGNEQPHINMAVDPYREHEFWGRTRKPERDEKTGEIKVARLAALFENSTTTRVTELTADRPEVTSLQVETARSLLLMPKDVYRRDRDVEVAGVYLGYCLFSLVAELAAQQAGRPNGS